MDDFQKGGRKKDGGEWRRWVRGDKEDDLQDKRKELGMKRKKDQPRLLRYGGAHEGKGERENAKAAEYINLKSDRLFSRQQISIELFWVSAGALLYYFQWRDFLEIVSKFLIFKKDDKKRWWGFKIMKKGLKLLGFKTEKVFRERYEKSVIRNI